MASITYDILVHILHYLQDDYLTLYRMSLANRTLRDTTAEFLYGRVTLSPPFSHTFSLARKDEFSHGLLFSACLPHNVSHVMRLEISGYLSPRPPPQNRLAAHLEAAIKLWQNLHTVVLTPLDYHGDLFTNIVPLLRECLYLRNLTVNASCTDESRAPALVTVEHLDSLTIVNPTRAILTLLPEWLGRLSPTLRELHLTDNCGSITPGVLRSFLPHMSEICSFSLGLSYSLTDDDVISFLNQLPNLRAFDFRYYIQLREPTIVPRLSALRSLTVQHLPPESRMYTGHLFRWIRRMVEHAPLAELRLRTEDAFGGPSVSFDGLLAHLTQKHAGTLRVLRMDAAFVGHVALRAFCARCVGLEELSVALSGAFLGELPTMLAPLQRLHTVRVQTRNARRSRVAMDAGKAQDLIERGPPNLRRLVVNGVRWEGRWASTSPEGHVHFIVEQVPVAQVSE